MPTEAASSRRTSGNAFPSARWKNWKTSPLAPQPKQTKRFSFGYTRKLASRSSWNGQEPE